jgi:hypothetical protein
MMTVENMLDDRLIRFYDNIRQQVEADRPHKHKLTSGSTVRQYAEQLRGELTRRRLNHTPIDWPFVADDQER